jgi:2,5-dihydroxypyridine 5,6-dioxygenase
MNARRELSHILEDVLRLCNVEAGEKVVLVSDQARSDSMLEAWRIGLSRVGADFLTALSPPKPLVPWWEQRNDGNLMLELMKSADMVIFQRTPGIPYYGFLPIYSNDFKEVVFSETRWLSCKMDETTTRRLTPREEVIRRTLAGAVRLHEAETIRITSEAGTDLSMSKKGRKGGAQLPVAREPGWWARLGTANVACAPLEETAEGTLVWDVMDSVGEAMGGMLDLQRERIVARFESGRIVHLEGGADARLLGLRLEQLATPNRPGVRRIAHVGWGTDDKAIFNQEGFSSEDWESYYGGVIIHFGVNMFDTPVKHSGLGGAIPEGTPHWGGLHLNCNLYLDGELVLENGRIIPDDLK